LLFVADVADPHLHLNEFKSRLDAFDDKLTAMEKSKRNYDVILKIFILHAIVRNLNLKRLNVISGVSFRFVAQGPWGTSPGGRTDWKVACTHSTRGWKRSLETRNVIATFLIKYSYYVKNLNLKRLHVTFRVSFPFVAQRLRWINAGWWADWKVAWMHSARRQSLQETQNVIATLY